MTTILFSIQNDNLDTAGVHTVISSTPINENTKIELTKNNPDLKSIKIHYCGHNSLKVIWSATVPKKVYANIQLKLT